MTLDEIQERLTDREFSFYSAILSEKKDDLDAFGEDAGLLRKSIEAKLGVPEGSDLSSVKEFENPGDTESVRGHDLIIPEFEEPALGSAASVLDVARVNKPAGKGDILRGQRVYYKGTQGIHPVKSVDRVAGTISIEVFGKAMVVARDMVSKVAPNEYDPRFHRRRRHKPMFAGAHAPRDDRGYDPEDD